MKALVFENKVIQIERSKFPVSGGMEWIDCGTDAKVGYEVINGAVIIPRPKVISLQEAKNQKISELSSKRYSVEIGGFDFNGHIISTDDRSKTLLMGAMIEAMNKPETFPINWKTSNGFVALNAVQIIAISNAVRSFVQSCFDNEKTHTDNILALTSVQAVKDYDIETGW